MDFAAMMAAQIAKAKGTTPKGGDKPTDDDKPAAGDTAAAAAAAQPAPKKFLSNAEAERQREAAYRAEQARLAAEREAKAAAKRKREDDAAAEAKAREEKRQRLAEESRRRREERDAAAERERRARLGLPPLPEDDDNGDGTRNPAGQDRSDGEGEDEDVPEDELRARLRALGLPAVLFGEAHRARLRRLRLASGAPIPTTLPPVEERLMKLDGKVPGSKSGRRMLARQLTSYFNMVLAHWQLTLQKEGHTPGTKEYSKMVQSRDTLRPLFRKLEKHELDDSILTAVVEIIKAAQERRYVDANDGYLRLSIGKAAWPIGVTMVGIHERSAREKLHNGERGHVMGDEVTRKYLQSIKRMLTFAQTRWPPEDINQLMG
ncbi:hypothetical protein RB595_000954 [Gaeumannomyces hyphopodioides]